MPYHTTEQVNILNERYERMKRLPPVTKKTPRLYLKDQIEKMTDLYKVKIRSVMETQVKKIFIQKNIIKESEPELLIETKEEKNSSPNKNKITLDILEKIPLYVIVNSNYEIICTREYKYNPPSTEWIADVYQEIFIPLKKRHKPTISLFFFNHKTAKDFYHELCFQKIANKKNSKIVKTNLNELYKLSRSDKYHSQIQIIGDLEEVATVSRKLLYNRSYKINPRQKYCNQWFQGTPIYKVLDEDHQNYTIFFNHKEARNALANRVLKYPYHPILKNSKIEICNLEMLIADLEKNENIEKRNIKFAPLPSLPSQTSSNYNLLIK